MYNLYSFLGGSEYPNLHFHKRRVINKLYGIGSHGLLFWGIALGILLLFLTPMRAEAVPFAYVINRNSNDVSLINTATNTVIATIPVGALPQGIAVTPDGSEVYVSHADAQAVFIIDTLTNTVVDIVGLPNRSQEVEITPDGMKAYVVVQDGNAVAVINTATRTVTNVIGGFNSPHGIGITPDGTKAYVTNFGPSHSGTTVSVIDISTNTIIATIPVGQGPIGVAITPDNTKVYVANNVTSTVSVINTATNTVIATLPTVGGLIDVEITPDGTEAFVTGGPSTTIIDTATDTVISSFPLGAVKFAFTSDGTKIYAPKPLFDVSVIDVASGTLIATIPVGENPVDVAITPDITVNLTALCMDEAVSADEMCMACASVNAGSFDPEGDAITVVEDPGCDYSLGSTIVTLTVSDGINFDSCEGTVTVVDTTPPDITCPANETVYCTSPDGALVSFSTTATDNCSGEITPSCTPLPSGSTFPLGNTINTCTATDNAGNQSTCSFTVTVVDTTPPEIQCNSPATITPKDAPISFTATAMDNCGASSSSITTFDCFFLNPDGRRIDKKESCVVAVSGDTITIVDSGGVSDH